MKQAVIWGAGIKGKHIYYCLKNSFDVLGWVDNDPKKHSILIDGLPVYSPVELIDICDNKTMIFICSAYYKDIKEQLNSMGFTNIIVYDLHFDKYWRNLVKGFLFESDAVSYSALGEDLIVEAVFRILDIDNPKYAEIGVLDPTNGSNTYLFYEKSGGNGILVEANPLCELSIRSVRPNDKYFSMGVGDKRGYFQLYMTETIPSSASFDKQFSTFWHDFMLTDNVVSESVQVVTFDDIFQNEGVQYLSIDIDGWDEDVICSIDFAKYPELLVMVSETTLSKRVRPYMLASGFVRFAQTRDNEIYIRKQVLPNVIKTYDGKRIYEFMRYVDAKEFPWFA